jgi:hypothetical protein
LVCHTPPFDASRTSQQSALSNAIEARPNALQSAHGTLDQHTTQIEPPSTEIADRKNQIEHDALICIVFCYPALAAGD